MQLNKIIEKIRNVRKYLDEIEEEVTKKKVTAPKFNYEYYRDAYSESGNKQEFMDKLISDGAKPSSAERRYYDMRKVEKSKEFMKEIPQMLKDDNNLKTVRKVKQYKSVIIPHLDADCFQPDTMKIRIIKDYLQFIKDRQKSFTRESLKKELKLAEFEVNYLEKHDYLNF
jgi:hypothetical protein